MQPTVLSMCWNYPPLSVELRQVPSTLCSGYCFAILGTTVFFFFHFYSEGHFRMQPHQSPRQAARVPLRPGHTMFPWLYMEESRHQRAQERPGHRTEDRKLKIKVTRSRRAGGEHKDEERGKIYPTTGIYPEAVWLKQRSSIIVSIIQWRELFAE